MTKVILHWSVVFIVTMRAIVHIASWFYGPRSTDDLRDLVGMLLIAVGT